MYFWSLESSLVLIIISVKPGGLLTVLLVTASSTLPPVWTSPRCLTSFSTLSVGHRYQKGPEAVSFAHLAASACRWCLYWPLVLPILPCMLAFFIFFFILQMQYLMKALSSKEEGCNNVIDPWHQEANMLIWLFLWAVVTSGDQANVRCVNVESLMTKKWTRTLGVKLPTSQSGTELKQEKWKWCVYVAGRGTGIY